MDKRRGLEQVSVRMPEGFCRKIGRTGRGQPSFQNKPSQILASRMLFVLSSHPGERPAPLYDHLEII